MYLQNCIDQARIKLKLNIDFLNLFNLIMDRVSHILLGLVNRDNKPMPLSYSASDAKNCMINLASCSFPSSATPEHLLLALYLRQPQMFSDFLGEDKARDLSRKLLGYEVYEMDKEKLFRKPLVEKTPVFLSPEVSRVFNTAESIAKLIKHSQVGCAELFLAVLMVKSRTRLNDVINNSGIDKTRVQRMFLETNLSKYDGEPPENLPIRKVVFSLN